ncbi:hypothetical protein HHI36_019727, partial [Cryptolaemus montrouzieri]
ENVSLSFGREQIDVCALCKLNPHINDNAKRTYQADIEIHRRQSNKYFIIYKKYTGNWK